MLSEEFRKIVSKLDSLHINDDAGYEKCWEEEVNLLSKNLNETINFLKSDCSADEFSWMSEVFDDIVEKTKSKEFIDCIEETSKRFTEECSKYNIEGAIKAAKAVLD